MYDVTPDKQDRQKDILTWISSYNKKTIHNPSKYPKLIHWIALDDIDLTKGRRGHSFHGHTVNTIPNIGFSQDEFDLAQALLNESSPIN